MSNSALRTCTKCGQSQPLSEFYTKPGHGDGHHTACKECMRAQREKKAQTGPLDRPARQAKGVAPAVKVPRRLPHVNGGYLYRPAPDASRAELEEFWTRFHMSFVAMCPRERVTAFLFLGFPIPEKLDVMHSPELRAQIVQYSHGFGARGWGQLFPWGTLPDACGHDAHATHKAALKGL